ncbi:MAG: glycosyltransferase, partial [Candidatus Hodarchaeota archaeon]
MIGSAGRLFPVKDYSLMVEIAKVISEKANKIHFMLAGDGPDRRKIQGLVKRYSLNDTFELVGHVENMAAFYGALDLYVNT